MLTKQITPRLPISVACPRGPLRSPGYAHTEGRPDKLGLTMQEAEAMAADLSPLDLEDVAHSACW